MKEQKEVLHELDELHCTTSLEEYNNLYRHTFRKWSEKCSDFAYYFEQQWNSGTSFNQWKVYCCPPGIATTNNALESFNTMFKRSYTNHTRHTLPALYDIIHDRLLVDLSRDIISARKVFHMKRIPERIAYVNANAINRDSYLIESYGSSMRLVNKESHATYHVDANRSTCMCKYFHKKGYCKHLLFVFSELNRDSDVIALQRTFKYKGNTKRTKKMRGRTKDALPALQKN